MEIGMRDTCHNHHLINAPVSCTYRNKTDRGYWQARSATLEVVTQSSIMDEAARNLDEALLPFVESCLRRGTVEQVLAEAGLPPVEAGAIRSYAKELISQDLQASLCHA